MELPIKAGDRPADFRLCTMGGVSKALRDYRGRKTLIFAWAPWCGCREFLGPLQRFHLKHPEVNVVSVAFDAQGVDQPLKYLTGARATFEMLLDASCILSRRWGLKRVGLLALLDENGTAMLVLDHPEEKDLSKVEKLLPQKPVSPVPPEAKVDHRNVKVELLVQACTNFLTRKKVQEAVESLRKALSADPENRIIARQVLVLQHPEKFYLGPIDREWVNNQPPVAPL
jgi:hypothetical protein